MKTIRLEKGGGIDRLRCFMLRCTKERSCRPRYSSLIRHCLAVMIESFPYCSQHFYCAFNGPIHSSRRVQWWKYLSCRLIGLQAQAPIHPLKITVIEFGLEFFRNLTHLTLAHQTQILRILLSKQKLKMDSQEETLSSREKLSKNAQFWGNFKIDDFEFSTKNAHQKP